MYAEHEIYVLYSIKIPAHCLPGDALPVTITTEIANFQKRNNVQMDGSKSTHAINKIANVRIT
jgi:hypothetical protein